VTYQKGSHPFLEEVVDGITSNCKNNREKALRLMRFCRDLYKRNITKDFSLYIYGGTEEELVEKPEELCECLGRLMVALCEIAGIPGRIVMHDIGGHITSETYIEGKWAYIDPRCGIYCLKPDGTFASTWEIWQNPELLRSQSEVVKADVSERFTWEERVWKCEKMYFHPREVNGFENYSLKDTFRYNYFQTTRKGAIDAGLLEINKKYTQTAHQIFGLAGDGYRLSWKRNKLDEPISLIYRNDGFTQFFGHKPPMTRAMLEEEFINPFEGTNVNILEWGLGPGSVFCYDTKVGQVCGDGLSEEQWKIVRTGDRWVHKNVMGLIRSGNDPLHVAVKRGHQIGLRVYARLEMNHEYGPADPNNWMWVVLVGDFNKNHPEFRISGSVNLDFKHKEVRDFKLAVFREAAETGVDGISMDFVVYPPYFEAPDKDIMTQFVRDVRRMLDEIGAIQNRRIDLIVRVPNKSSKEVGLDWETWMNEGLIDVVIPYIHPHKAFDIVIDDFVSLGHKTGCKVYGCIWQALGFAEGDPTPSDKGRRRYEKEKTKGMYYSQALLFQRAGADGIQLAMGSGEWNSKPWFNDLADPKKIEYADKHYMVDCGPYMPLSFQRSKNRLSSNSERKVSLRIADDISNAHKASYSAEAILLFYSRSLQKGEKIEIYVNNKGPVVVSGDSPDERNKEVPIDWKKGYAETGLTSITPSTSHVFQPDWWKRGEHKIPVSAKWWKMGKNTIRLNYSVESPSAFRDFSIQWIELVLKYNKMEEDKK
ncbi:MAG: hypothetical protein IMF11_06110, partial [Proteobacteria bacterium]|nr:hypothetical protein [Pseudomonadota bacterium]